MPIEHTSIYNINFEQNKKLGYYIVDGEIYYSKLQALIDATTKKVMPKWVFNDSNFARVDWTVCPEVDINELYRIRAQQIRDQYDYVRLECSGGSDSTTVAFAFLLNNIHLDEVVFRYPKSGDKNVTDNPWDTSSTNTLSEWQYAAQPLLQWIATNYPQTKITFHDYAADMIADTSRDETWIFRTQEYCQPGHADKHRNFFLPEHRTIADSGKSICVLYGVDKPKCVIHDGKWFLFFTDIQTNHANPDIGEYTNITNEYFFWSPDLPEMLVKQAHIVKNWFDMPQNVHLKYLVEWPNNRVTPRTVYENIIKAFIYPDYDCRTFQVSKPFINFKNEMDHWFHTNFKDDRLYQVWESGIKYLVDNIADHFIVKNGGEASGFISFMSPFYYLGDCKDSYKSPVYYNARVPDKIDIRKVINKKLIITPGSNI